MPTVIRRYPTGDGDISGTFTNNWDEVDDVVTSYSSDTSGDTDYITSPGSGTPYHLFTFTAFDIHSAATSITVTVCYRASDAGTSGTNRIHARLKVGSNYYNLPTGTGNNPGASFAGYQGVWSTNPATTSAWTYTEVEALSQFGFYVSDDNPALRVSICYIECSFSLDRLSVERKTGAGGSYAEVSDSAYSSTPYADTGPFTNGETYYYRARRYDGATYYSYTNEVNVTYTTTSVVHRLATCGAGQA